MPLHRLAAGLVLMAILLVVDRHAANLSAQESKLPEDLKDLNLEEFRIKPVAAQKDPKTGFIVGGKNATDLIRSLTEINGRKITDLEALMRPDPQGFAAESSMAGFLGPTESLLAIMAEDNRYVVDELGLSHQDLARPLLILGAAGGYERKPQKFTYHGRRFEVKKLSWKGFQFSPFGDRTSTSQDAVVKNLENGQEIDYSLLVPQMIERYGFYEGKGTSYRVEPRQVVAVFDFLAPPGATPATREEVSSSRKVALWTLAVAALGLVIWLALFRGRRANISSQ